MGLQNEGIPWLENVKFKAFLVAKGYKQKEGVEFNEVC